MARLGFQIGKALNIGARFAIGAGGLEGSGSKLLETAGELVGGGHQAGAGASLSERLRGGLSAVSPQFAQSENIRSAIEARGVSAEIDRGKLEQQRTDAEAVSIEGIMPGLSDETRQLAIEDLRQAGLVERDAEGNETVTRGAMRKELEAFNTDPVRQRKLISSEVNSSANQLKKMNVRVNTLMEKEMQKAAREAGLDFKTMSDKSKQELKATLVEKFQADPSQNPEANTLQQEIQKIFEQKEQWEDRLDSLDEAQQQSKALGASAKQVAFLPNPEGEGIMAGTTNKLTGEFQPSTFNGQPIILEDDAAVLKFQGKKAESINDPFVISLEKRLGREEAIRITDLKEDANKSGETIKLVDRALEILDEGIFSGSLGKQKLALAKFGKAFGVPVDVDKIVNTETYKSLLGNVTGQIITLFGSGTGLSDKDAERAEQIAQADISVDPESLRKGLMELRRLQRNTIDNFNQNMIDVKAGREASDPFGLVKDPGEFVPSGRTSFTVDSRTEGERQKGLGGTAESGGGAVDSFIKSMGGIQ